MMASFFTAIEALIAVLVIGLAGVYIGTSPWIESRWNAFLRSIRDFYLKLVLPMFPDAQSLEPTEKKGELSLNIGSGTMPYGTSKVDKYPASKQVIWCDIDKDQLPFDDCTFDKVYSRFVFEHLTNHSNYMKEAWRVLKPGGELEIITDNAMYYGWWMPFASMPEHDPQGNVQGDDDRHYCLFTAHHLRNWAEKFGFTSIRTEYVVSSIGRLKLIRGLMPLKFAAQNVRLTARKVI